MLNIKCYSVLVCDTYEQRTCSLLPSNKRGNLIPSYLLARSGVGRLGHSKTTLEFNDMLLYEAKESGNNRKHDAHNRYCLHASSHVDR